MLDKVKASQTLSRFNQKELLELCFQLWKSFFNEQNVLQQLSYFPMGGAIQTYKQTSLSDLENFVDRLKSSYYPKDSKLNLFIGASTVALTPFVEILRSLLLQVPIICRLSEEFSLGAYSQLKVNAPLKLRECFDFVYWKSSDFESAKKYFAEADALMVHGSDETISKLKEQWQKKNFFGFGHKASFAVCQIESGLIEALIQDLLAFGGNGCLTPQTVFVVNGDSEAFARELAGRLKTVSFQLTAAESFILQTKLQELALVKGCQVFESRVLYSAAEGFEYVPLRGTVWVKTLRDTKELSQAVSCLNNRIGSIGTNLERQKISQLFPRTRVSEIGFMQRPDLFWFQEPTHLIY